MNKPAMLAMLLTPAALFADPSVERVIVRQQWPWSTDVKVEYSLSGVGAAHPVDISVRAFNDGVELPSANLDAAITGDRYGITDAVGSLTIDPVKAFGTEQVALGSFTVQLSLSASSANMDDILYKIVDLVPDANNNYAVTDVRRKDFYNGKYQDYVTSFSDIDSSFSTSLDPADVLIWRGVTNDIYKTDKMVFRRIPAQGQSYMMLTNNTNFNSGKGYEVSFSKDFYISVFELTQSQMAKFYTRTCYETNALYKAKRPATWLQLKYHLRGDANNSWPGNQTHTDMQSGTANIIGNMQKKLKLRIDLPTEAMWEYACRAGTDTALYTGNSSHTAAWNSQMQKKLVRSRGHNRPDSDTASRNSDLTDATAEVGTYLPNAFGLYDMLGNAGEWCLDFSGTPTGGVDPVGPSSGSQRIVRGGDWHETAGNCCCHWRGQRYGHYDTYYWLGARLCIWLSDENDDGVLP